MRRNRRYGLILFVSILFFAIAAPAAADIDLSTSPGGGGSACTLKPGKTCFHVFTSTHTPTDGDSVLFQVNMCRIVSYYFKGDGTASLKIRESGNNSKTGATIFAPDWDADGKITTSDENIAIDGVVGSRSFSRTPRAPWQYSDVITVPASGSAILVISCQ